MFVINFNQIQFLKMVTTEWDFYKELYCCKKLKYLIILDSLIVLLIRRGLAQVCPSPPMRVLVSIGGPQQGLTQLPQCGEFFEPLGYDCIKIHQATNKIAYQP